MKFIDEADIEVSSGSGGSGACHFRREKFIPRGGPDGGNGGDGGSVFLRANENCQTLLDFQYQPIWKAENGKPGGSSRADGRRGKDLYLSVPVGTQVFSLDDSSSPLFDLTLPDQEECLLQGGRGGKGNAFFKGPTNRAPRKFQPGEEGKTVRFRLSLKLLADVGLIGKPNAGKSTLLRTISAAEPRVADYPFTTLEPCLGVVRGPSGNSFVLADIPGLIPGAHAGRGLGTQFLKHVERTRVLAHLLDPFALNEDGSPIDLLTEYQTIREELRLFSSALSEKPELVVLTKAELFLSAEEIAAQAAPLTNAGIDWIALSSVSRTGLDTFLLQVEKALKNEAIPGDCSESPGMVK